MTDGTICAENEPFGPFGGLSIIGLLNKNLEKTALSPHQNLTETDLPLKKTRWKLEDLTEGSLCLEFTAIFQLVYEFLRRSSVIIWDLP